MNKIIKLCLCALILFTLTGCFSEDELTKQQLKNEIKRLEKQKLELQSDVDYISSNLEELINVNDLKEYIVTINIGQKHYTFDFDEHIKDSLNNIEIELSVSKKFYDSVSVGTVINDDFRYGSMISKGSFGRWNIKVVDKEVRYYE